MGLGKMGKMAKPLGRPPLEPGHRLTMIRLSELILDRIDAVMGKKNQRSTFIREAIERELQRREKKTVLVKRRRKPTN